MPVVHLTKLREAMRTALVGVAMAGFVSGCAAPAAGRATASPTPRPKLVFDGQRALSRVEAQVAFGDRSPGAAGHAPIQDWIAGELATSGWPVERQIFTYQGTALTNLIGTSSTSGSPYILIGAHYDNRPVADQSLYPDPGPVPGADDGASGVAVLLGLADVLPTDLLGCRLELAFFDGEDSGELNGWDWVVGSTYLAQHLEASPDSVVVVDMVGDSDLQLYYERNSDPALRQAIWETATGLGYSSFIPQEKYSMIDDHTPFLNQGIAAVDIIDFDYPYWHTLQDTPDKVSAASLEAVGRTLQAWLEPLCK